MAVEDLMPASHHRNSEESPSRNNLSNPSQPETDTTVNMEGGHRLDTLSGSHKKSSPSSSGSNDVTPDLDNAKPFTTGEKPIAASDEPSKDEAQPDDAEPTPADPEGPPDPYAHLPDDEAAILKRQIDKPERKYSFWHIYRFATKLDIFIIIVSAVASAASGAAMPAMTIIFGGLQGVFQEYLFYQRLTFDEFESEVAEFILYFVYLAIGTFFATYISTVGFIYTGEHITSNLRQRYLESCLRQNIGFFDNLGAGEVAVKITSDANRIQDGISEKVGLLIAAIATVLTGFVIGFVVSWKLTLIMSSVVVAFVLNTTLWTKCLMKYAIPMAIAGIQASSLTQEIFSAVRVVVAFGCQPRLVDQYDVHLKSSQGNGVKVKAAVGMMMAVIMGVMHLIYGLGFWQGSLFLSRGELSLENLLTALMAVMVGSLTVASIGPYYQGFVEAVTTVSSLAAIIDRESPIDASRTGKGEKPDGVEGNLRFENIKHIYPSRPDVVVMDQVALDFEAGKVTALVGASGSGKSTVIGLIERFYSPVQGRIFLDGRDISTLNLCWLRQQIGYVGQEPVLFAGSVLDNIRYGLIGSVHEHADQATQRQLIETAAKDANMHDFVCQLPDGYDTDVGQRGLSMSGGQKQRIAIARAIVSNPKILLLDEATSALDTKSEGVVQAALDQASKGRTTITIAHRMSTIRDAHKIIVMAQGRVIEEGNHFQLLAKQGAYYELVTDQQVPNAEAQSASPVNSSDDTEHDEGNMNALSVNSETKVLIPDPLDPVDATAHQSATERQKGPNNENDPEAANEDPKQEYSTWTLLKFVYSLSRPEAMIMIIAVVFCIICGLATPVQAVFFAKQIIILSDIGVPGTNKGQLKSDSNFWSLMFLMLGLVTFFAQAIQSIMFGHTAEALIRRVRRQTFNHMLRQDVSFFDKGENNPSALTASLAVETTQLTNMSGGTLGNIIVSLTIVIGGIALSVAIGWKLALVCLSVVPVIIVCSIVRFYILYKYTDRASRVYVASAAYASENIAAMKTLASLTLEGVVADKYGDAVKTQCKQSLRSVLKSGALYAASNSAMFLCLGLAFWYGSTLLGKGEYDVFQFFVSLMSVLFGSQSAGSLLTFIPDFVKARHSAAHLKALFDKKPMVDIWDNTKGQRLDQTNGWLEFRDVRFRYPTRTEKAVLQGLDIVVKPGQHAALVGASGCGKSTIISLLERFYDPTGGQIVIDGVDITKLQVNSYRSHFALVSQEPALFQGSIRDNICMGTQDEQVSDESIDSACKSAAIYDFIASLPEGLGTDIGTAGALLSGGQKQRIAIARALIRQPKVLLLDEATSALDNESEHLVQAALERAAVGRTTVTVAHRLSTISNADIIYVIDQGRVAESGSHQELMARDGMYAGMVKLQSLGE